jgi:YfiH family protein
VANSFHLGPDCIYRCDAFQQFVWQRHGFGTRLGNPPAEITLKQVHSNQIVNANGIQQDEREGDGLITDEVGKSIGVRTADCVPILLLDCRRRAVGAVHAGWRGTVQRVALHAVERMRADFLSDPRDLYAAIGPCIRDCCYEVGSEVAERFAELFPERSSVLVLDGEKRKICLPEANRQQLHLAGIPVEQIFDCGLCTACESSQFFSHRREPLNPGRMNAAIERLA